MLAAKGRSGKVRHGQAQGHPIAFPGAKAYEATERDTMRGLRTERVASGLALSGIARPAQPTA